MRLTKVATCSLNQWAMDFEGNLGRIVTSIRRSREVGARIRVGPELEIPGYGCEDHFLEADTFAHSAEVIAALISGGHTDDMLVDVGAPILHRGIPYNCRVLLLNREVVLVRPKMFLADDGNYREPRWFRAWPPDRKVESYTLPDVIRKVTSSSSPTVPIGPAILESSEGVSVACELCEELWTPASPHIAYASAGVDLILNSSASHHELRKLGERVDLLRSATSKAGGAYIYANQIGCDGGRLYYDGCSMVVVNGQIVAQGSQFMLHSEVEVVSAVVDLDDVSSYRQSKASLSAHASSQGYSNANSLSAHRIHLSSKYRACIAQGTADHQYEHPSPPLTALEHHTPEREIAFGPACWLWDYLRRSSMSGFLLPLSGGADSSSSAAIVGSMCTLVVDAILCEETPYPEDRDTLLEAVRSVTGDPNYVPQDARDLCSRILHTVYMGNGVASSSETQSRASSLAQELGAWHCAVDIGQIIDAVLATAKTILGENRTPRFSVHGGSRTENVALQNIQARSRMLLAYFFAQLLPWARGRHGSLLVLGSANVDEGLRGYLTKYDCSSADINPIGGICKADLRSFLIWASQAAPDGLGYQTLARVAEAKPTAELEPITESHAQTDEEDMGMTYEELTWYGKLRKIHRCGPVSMFRKLIAAWHDKEHDLTAIATKVKYFFRMYAINRHKMTTLTPSYHAVDYSPEDNRFDLRQFLYNARWTWQFRAISQEVGSAETMRETKYLNAHSDSSGREGTV